MRFWKAAVLSVGLSVGLVPSVSWADAAAEVNMKLLPSGAMPKLGGYRPQRLELSPEKPADLKKAPELASPLYGKIQFGDRSYLVALDEPEGKEAHLYVDSNGNGDLTDDPAITWSKRAYPSREGPQLTQYMGSFQLPLATGDKPTMVSLGAYRFDKNDSMRAALKNSILYYADYAYDGQITLGDKTYHAMLADDFATGDFRGKKGDDARIRLVIDRNGDGQFDQRSEMFDASKPFNVGGTTWVLSDLTAGGTFKIAKSDQKVDEVLPPPDHSVGKVITAFKATTMDGKAVNFPADYKGKVVMLDFWATWCGPCMAEVPNLVKTYNEFHPKGIEILGISLDQEDSADKVKKVTADNGMTWPQVYDGKFWAAGVAKKYGIDSIPSAFLVDGDTGKVLANGNALRGENLAETFKKALDGKSSEKK